MKKVAGRLRLDLAQYRELAAFAQFGSDLDKATQAQLDARRAHGRAAQAGPVRADAVEEQVIVIYAGTNGYLDDVPVSPCAASRRSSLVHSSTKHPRSPKTRKPSRRQSTLRTSAQARRYLEEFEAVQGEEGER